MAPQLLPRARLESIDTAVTGAGNELSLAFDDRDDGRLIRRIHGKAAGGARPIEITGLLVERENAISRAGVVTPAECDTGDEDLILIDRRRRRAPSEGGDHPELFGHLALPEDLAALAVEADEVALRAQHIDAPGRG